ncbi:hypothetical protein HYX08_02390 [Candidatus Woesearchaeota archaeon]|nr:hypothetical protein [Candidatus Woesearchaeota archaeon]
MIQQLQQVFHSIIKSLEVLYVMENAKPCSRILVSEDGLAKALEFLKSKEINVAVSGFKVLKQTAQSEFYSDRSVKIPKNDERKGYFFVYLSKSMETAEKARLMEERGNHVELGLLLGYPKCCCEFFAQNFNEENTDLTLKALENSEGYEFPFYTNVAARHFDVSILSHFPHSFQCSPSIETAKNNLKIIQRHSEQLAAMFAGILQSTVIYTAEEGVFLLRKHEKISDVIVYSDLLTTSKSKLYFLLASNRELKIIGKNSFVVSDVNIEGPQYGIMVFK